MADLVSSSGLDIEQKTLWELFLKISLPEEDEAIFEAANQGEENLRLLSNHLRQKIRYIKETDPALYAELDEAEKRFIEIPK